MTATDRAAEIIGKTWYQGGGAYPGPGPSWKAMAWALTAAGLLVTDELAALIAERDHIIQFADDGWTIAHPLHERLDGSLFDCDYHWDHDDPDIRGRFRLLDPDTLGDEVRP